ncbi:MAG: glycosyltransferase family 4 protein [Gemmatimonadales bacterium]
MTAPLPRVLLMTGEWPVKSARRQAEALHDAGVCVEIFAYRAAPNPYGYLAAWTRLRPRLHRGRYDVAHAQAPESVLLALPKRVPLVVTLDHWQPLDRRLARRADAVIVSSEELRARVRTRAPVHVIAPDLAEAALAARLLDVYQSVVSLSA